jgi:hypothetical protein
MPWWLWLIIILIALSPFHKQIQAAGKRMEEKAKLAKNAEPPQYSSNINTPYFWSVEEGATYVAGTKHYQPTLKSIAGNHGNSRAEVFCVAVIVPETDNPHDDLAVRIDINNKIVGYLPRDDARSYRKRLDRKKFGPVTTQCAAKVWGGFDRNGDPHDYGVDIYIKPFAE